MGFRWRSGLVCVMPNVRHERQTKAGRAEARMKWCCSAASFWLAAQWRRYAPMCFLMETRSIAA